MDSLQNRDQVPPFPESVPTHPLTIIDYELIKQGDEQEIHNLLNACKVLGFFYLKNHGVESNNIFDIGRQSLRNLPQEEKLKYKHDGAAGSTFGYKPAGANLASSSGAVDTVEWWNIAKDDIVAYPGSAYRTYAKPIETRMSELKTFVYGSESVGRTLLEALNGKLGLPEGYLASCHLPKERSLCEVTLIRNPGTDKPQTLSNEELAVGEHTDFGSISLLHNVLGGLQVLPPDSKKWVHVKPLDGHMICNVGDALAIFSGGLLRSNIHRVIPQPGEQMKWDRWTAVYFFRPHGSCEMRHLVESPLIAQNASKAGVTVPPGTSAAEWMTRRVKYFHKDDNQTAEEAWKQARGTEQQ